jgi:hypothetical protein
MRRATPSFSIAPAYKGSTIGAIDACGAPPVPSLRQESSAQYGAIGAKGPEGAFHPSSLAVNDQAPRSRFSRFGVEREDREAWGARR